MTDPARDPNHIDAPVRREIVEFLRDWLPATALQTYREMIAADPEGWSRDAHFAGGVIAQHALRGNGITEKALGIRDLDAVWPDLLREAVEAPDERTGYEEAERKRV